MGNREEHPGNSYLQLVGVLALFLSNQIHSEACNYIQKDRADPGMDKAWIWIWEPKGILYWTCIDYSEGMSFKACSNVCCTGIQGRDSWKVSKDSSVCIFLGWEAHSLVPWFPLPPHLVTCNPRQVPVQLWRAARPWVRVEESPRSHRDKLTSPVAAFLASLATGTFRPDKHVVWTCGRTQINPNR